MRLNRLLPAILLFLGIASQGMAAGGRIVKVLPHFLDTRGRHTLSPSLFERDAYQAHLRKNPALCSGIRFDVQWSARAAKGQPLKLRIEARANAVAEPLVLEKNLGTNKRRGWAGLALQGRAFQEAGDIVAWKATLIRSGRVIAQKKSFLWREAGESSQFQKPFGRVGGPTAGR